MSSILDVIIFGATGFTGKFTVYAAAGILQNLRWGIAGRNRDKLEAVLEEMGTKANKYLMNIPIIIADISDKKSLLQMAKSCRVLVNCCGPYRLYGEVCVEACIEAGTHHVDVSGEPQYMESMQLKYHKKAEEKNIYVISSCGFDSIPADMGIVFIEKNFDGIVNSVEAYLQCYVDSGSTTTTGGPSLNMGTWESAIYAVAHESELRTIRSQLFQSELPKFHPVLKHRAPIFRSDILSGICVPFPGVDRDVVFRSQRYFYENEQKRPVQMNEYFVFKSFFTVLKIMFGGINLSLFSRFACGRRLLLKYPKFFSSGFISHEGPTEQSMESVRFIMTFKAIGWPKSLENSNLNDAKNQSNEAPKKTLIAKVSGTNPGYGATCVSLLCCALTILRDNDKMPSTGGVYSPGAAFAKTCLIEELQNHERGLKFEIVTD